MKLQRCNTAAQAETNTDTVKSDVTVLAVGLKHFAKVITIPGNWSRVNT